MRKLARTSDLEAIIKRLVDSEVEFVLIGGYAAILYGVSLMTKDVDVCCPFTAENLKRIVNALADLHPYHQLTPQNLPFVVTETFHRGLKNLYIGTDIGRVDFLGHVEGIGGFDEVRARSVHVHVPNADFLMIDIDALIAAKQIAGREHDRAAVVQLDAIRKSARTPHRPPPTPEP